MSACDSLNLGVVPEARVMRRASVAQGAVPASLVKLTPRNRQVLELLADGCADKEIALELHISPRTVKQHMVRMRVRAGLPLGCSRAALISRLRPVAGTFHLPATIHLTPRESDILLFMVEGLRNHAIADRLGTTEQTVKNFNRSIFDKTGMSSRSEVAAWYRAHCSGEVNVPPGQ